MKDHQIRRTWVVTVQIPCTICKVLMPESEVTKRSTYILGEGRLHLDACCIPCFNEAKRVANAQRDETPEGD